MIYILDGYNILFLYMDASRPFAKQRDALIQSLQKKFKEQTFVGFLVFDGSHRRDEESGRSYASPLEIVYTPRGQTADSYIIEKARGYKNPKEVTIVTNDQGLSRQAKVMQVHVHSAETFFLFLEKKAKKTEEKKFTKDSPKNMQRLLDAFLNPKKDDFENF